jgi:aminopeptidase N
MKKITSAIIIMVLACTNRAQAQDTYAKNEAVDIKNYVFNLLLSDESNDIFGETNVTVEFLDTSKTFTLDLVGKSGEFGMEVTDVLENNSKANYQFSENKILITTNVDSASTRTFTIKYHGVAEKGLVIDTTKFGQRSFFGDNWPTLARYWLPCIDHPYDKASVEFNITAPEYYDVIATGRKVEESNVGNGFKLTRYIEPAPVAMKVVTIGVTKFATSLLDMVGSIPVTAWVYPENRLDGFSDFAVSAKILTYYIQNVGPYSYAKLANMQAKTQWGGLENAGTIAYFENSVTGKNTIEGLIAHEIAHQWFGNSATENNWNHVWLSEGFATYFTILYMEEVYGNEKRKEMLSLDRKKVINYYQKNPSPVVDNTISDPRKVLSTNSYKKGGWVLNMLRHKLGDEVFWKGIRTYYSTYMNTNVMTADFQKVMESVSDMSLDSFFQQWIFTKGYPEIEWTWKYKKSRVIISIKQKQEHYVFQFPLEIGFVSEGKLKTHIVQVDAKSQTFEISTNNIPESIVLDPEIWLLFDEKSDI